MADVSLYVGRAGTGKSYAVYERIKKVIQECPGEPIILLVPEPATYKVERELAEFMPGHGFTTVRVVGLNRLAHQVFQSIGKVRAKSISKVGRNLLMRLVMHREKDQLTLLKKAAYQPHFSNVLLSLFSEFKAFRVSPKDLENGAKRLQSQENTDGHLGTLCQKLQELAHLMKAYEDAFKEHGQEDKDSLEELIKDLPQTPLMKNAHVFVDGFHWFTSMQYQLIFSLIQQAKEFVMTLTLPGDSKERGYYQKRGTLFNRPYEVYDTIGDFYSALYGRQVKIVTFTKNQRFEKSLLADFESHFFHNPILDNSGTERLPIIKAYNREREADAVCRRILSYVMEGNGGENRWKNIMIMLRESDTYGDILEKRLRHYGIPFFMDRQRPMETHPLAELLQALFEIVQSRFNHDAMFRMLKTDLFPLEAAAVDELENYCLEFGIKDFMWLRDEWTYESRTYESDIEGQEREKKRRESVNESHKIIMDILKPWYTFSRQSHTGLEWCQYFFGLIEKLKIGERLRSWSKAAEDKGDMEDKASHEQMYTAFISFLDEITELGGQDKMTGQEMAELLKEGLGEVNYSMVPPSLDHVLVTTVERGYNHQRPRVFVMGLNEGVFPQRMGEEGLLRDKDRDAFVEAMAGVKGELSDKISLAAGALVRAFNENFLLYLACTRASQELVLSYADSDTEGSQLEASLLVDRLKKHAFIEEPELVPMAVEEGREKDYLWRLPQSLSLLAYKLGEMTKGLALSPIWWGLYEWTRQNNSPDDEAYHLSLRQVIRGIKDTNDVPMVSSDVVKALFLSPHKGKEWGQISGSVTRLEKYQVCPFKFYAEYGLKLKERPIKTFGAPEIGTFLHECLRLIGTELLATKRQWRDLSPKEAVKVCEDAVDKIAQTPAFKVEENSKYQENLYSRLLATLNRTVGRMVDWSSKSLFETRYLEQSFGGHSDWKPLLIDFDEDKAVRLQGQIDRVDIATIEGQEYAMVIDYKTGNNSIHADDIYYGLKLQLVTYLLALEKAGFKTPIDPAAVVYTFVQNPRISENSIINEAQAKDLAANDKNLKNAGYFSDDIAVLQGIDDSVGAKASNYVPVRLTTKGGIHGQDKSKTKSLEDFSSLTFYTEHMIGAIGKNVCAGKYPIKPYQKGKFIPCSYCEYRALCRFEQGRNSYRYLDNYEEARAMDLIKEKNREEGGSVYEMD